MSSRYSVDEIEENESDKAVCKQLCDDGNSTEQIEPQAQNKSASKRYTECAPVALAKPGFDFTSVFLQVVKQAETAQCQTKHDEANKKKEGVAK